MFDMSLVCVSLEWPAKIALITVIQSKVAVSCTTVPPSLSNIFLKSKVIVIMTSNISSLFQL